MTRLSFHWGLSREANGWDWRDRHKNNCMLTQTQVGIPLELDIGVIDVNTCEPLEDVLISLWVCSLSSPILQLLLPC
jgi:protocatechuate 3,4-dioxygenase beta subunit